MAGGFPADTVGGGERIVDWICAGQERVAVTFPSSEIESMSVQDSNQRALSHSLRQVGLSVVAMAVVSIGMAAKGWHAASVALGGMCMLMALLVLLQVWRALHELHSRAVGLDRIATDAEKHYLAVLRRVMRVWETREKYGQGRGERIGKLAEQIARRLQLPESKCRLMNLAGQLHDIGLLAVPEEVLMKTSSLTVQEFGLVKKHSEISYEVLRPLASISPILPAVRYHHERMNGTGYPSGLMGEAIPYDARVLAVVDAYDAMTHDRPHRPALTPLQAMDELRRCSPEGYDKDIVELLCDIMHYDSLKKACQAAEDAPEESELGSVNQPAGSAS